MQKAATGKRKFLLTKQLIEMRQDQYVLKNSYNPPITLTKITKSINQIQLDEKITIENNEPKSNGIVSVFNVHHVSCLLNNYSKIKE